MSNPQIWQFSLNALHATVWGGSLLVALLVFSRFMTLRTLAGATLLASLALVALGAYVRLSNAGLGCPDWPGCYGKLSPTQAADQIQAAETAAPGGPVSLPKAWREMVHRYFASFVGVMILAFAIRVLNNRRKRFADPDDPATQIGLPLALVAIVVLQGLFGKWTVTLLLKPVIVTLHLLGGMTLVAFLAWLYARHSLLTGGQPSTLRGIRPLAAIGLIVLGMQIALGGWVSTNYAALACVDFPTCHGSWKPTTDFVHGFHFLRELGMTAEGEPLSNDALNAIHWAHRVGALLTFLTLIYVALRALRLPALRKLASMVLMLLIIQITLGMANVLGSLPLPVAVAHNGVAALLLATLVMLNFATRSPSSFGR
ncbi:MAG TPA: COX15/CtaA family protein [Burkholderiales bacterium]|nr:COX15/CtaA family protein [Burkholderiales bacterium]